MKKHICIILLFLTGFTVIHAQRMLPKQKGIELNAGILSTHQFGNDYYLNIAITVNGKNGNYKIWALEYTHQYYNYKDLKIPHETFVGEVGYSIFLMGDSGKNISLNTALTAIAGYETINRSEEMLSDGSKILSEDNFIYGAGGRLSLETYITDRIIIFFQAKARMIWGTDLAQLRPSAGLGIRFNL